jgi:hypothetical protein
MAQACFAGPNGIALQFSAHAVDENAAAKAINAEVILSVAVTDPLQLPLSPMQRLYVGQPNVIRPSVRAYRGRVTAPIIGAVFSKKMRTIASALSKFV